VCGECLCGVSGCGVCGECVCGCVCGCECVWCEWV